MAKVWHPCHTSVKPEAELEAFDPNVVQLGEKFEDSGFHRDTENTGRLLAYAGPAFEILVSKLDSHDAVNMNTRPPFSI